MKSGRFIPVLAIVAVLMIASAVIIKQHLRISRLRQSRRNLTAQNQELSATNTSLLSVDAGLNDELNQLQQQTLELLRLRSQLTQARQQPAAADAQPAGTENTNEFAGYVTKEQLKFAGYDTPENAFQSLNWASETGDYTNWLAALAPEAKQEELENSNSLQEFQIRSRESRITGMQVLATKPIGNDRVELKVRFDTESAVGIYIYPMVAVGNEWKLVGDIDSYTRAWDNPSSSSVQ